MCHTCTHKQMEGEICEKLLYTFSHNSNTPFVNCGTRYKGCRHIIGNAFFGSYAYSAKAHNVDFRDAQVD